VVDVTRHTDPLFICLGDMAQVCKEIKFLNCKKFASSALPAGVSVHIANLLSIAELCEIASKFKVLSSTSHKTHFHALGISACISARAQFIHNSTGF
jgi:hypothetical protein